MTFSMRESRVDLKGTNYVPETVYHLVVDVDPVKDSSWGGKDSLPTDQIHIKEIQSGQVLCCACLPCLSKESFDVSGFIRLQRPVHPTR